MTLRRYFQGLMLFLCAASFLQAQLERAAVTGVVADPSGSVLGAASVTARHLRTGVETTTVSTGAGVYYISLPAGEYSLTTAANGFATTTVER
ncbi:MAG TPA: carboxypeptidase-like regulatory domain-containing protein, partial [Bryobacteraceae bacterium]|nr:carboxypeptidase-like regulatory domain-containing protein [Bryobacteraceae bacterium]